MPVVVRVELAPMIAYLLAAAFTLLSPQFASNAALGNAQAWNRDGCHGANRSPALRWTNAPKGTRSFALTVFDPDAGPAGWWHWIAFDIPASAHALRAGIPASARPPTQGVNDFGAPGYGGPCPPPGAPHRYVFTVYALDVSHLDARAVRGAALRSVIAGHVLGQATLVGRYGR